MELKEVVVEAEYADIIISLIAEPYRILSITKIIFIAFCVKHEEYMSSYRGRTKDFVDVFFRNISLKLATNYKDIEKIIHVIDILVKTNRITVNGDVIEVKEEIPIITENNFLRFCSHKVPNPILEINKLDATAMIEEVIRYV